MKWPVVRLSGACNLARSFTRANSTEREREVVRAESVTAPAEMR